MTRSTQSLSHDQVEGLEYFLYLQVFKIKWKCILLIVIHAHITVTVPG